MHATGSTYCLWWRAINFKNFETPSELRTCLRASVPTGDHDREKIGAARGKTTSSLPKLPGRGRSVEVWRGRFSTGKLHGVDRVKWFSRQHQQCFVGSRQPFVVPARWHARGNATGGVGTLSATSFSEALQKGVFTSAPRRRWPCAALDGPNRNHEPKTIKPQSTRTLRYWKQCFGTHV